MHELPLRQFRSGPGSGKSRVPEFREDRERSGTVEWQIVEINRVRLYLASRSPRRRELLAGLGYRFTVLDAGVDETRAADEPPSRYVERMAREKALAGFGLASRRPVAGAGDEAVRAVVVAADTAVVVDARVLGKPRDDAEILTHLEWLSGRAHDVLSAVAVASGYGASPRVEVRVCPSRVWFRKLSAAEREAYRATGEPADKAGSYAIQGLAAAFVTRLDGSWSAVVGLPVPETVELLGRADVPFLGL